MAQHDYVIANGTGAAVRSDLNNGLAAIVSNNSGATEPATMYAYQWWPDTTTGLLKLRNSANNAWVTVGTLASTNLGLLPLAGGTMTGALLVDDSGTAALPAIAFDGDPDTGVFRAGANEFGIATNGVERVKFGTTEVVFNDGGADVDLRVEGDTKANLLLVNAGADTVSIDGTQQLANQTPLRFGDSHNSHYVALRSPATVAANVTWDLPATDGTVDQVLKTNGSGVLGWGSGSFASTSEVSGTHTTGTVTSGSASLTVASATGITAGMFIVGEGIAPGTTVSSIASTTVTMSANAGATLSSDPVAFYIANKSLSPGLVAGQLCRAWVNFDGTGTVAIRASFNVSSITDGGVGIYTVNFTTALADANYAVTASATSFGWLESNTYATGSVKLRTFSESSGSFPNADNSIVCISVFR